MPPGGADLLFDEVVVVEKPFGRGRDPSPAPQRLRYQLIRFAEDDFVLGEPRQEVVAAAITRRDLVPSGERFRVLLKLKDAEELGAEGVFFVFAAV